MISEAAKQLRIIYLGTPEFAVPGLKTLVENGLNVVAVVTAPDKPAGRGQKIQYSEVKQAALELGLPVLQPEKLKNPEFLAELASYQADLQIVVAFRMLPVAVWDMPRFGTFNLHASLLPKYRGAAPINHAIINGETETGITTFFLRHEIDTGPLVFQEREPIYPEDNVGSLYKRLMNKGADLILKTVLAVTEGDYPAIEQDAYIEGVTPIAPKIFRETCQLSLSKGAEAVHNHVRGLSPYPGAWMLYKEKTYKIYQTALSEEAVPSNSAELFNIGKQLYINCSGEALEVLQLQPEGKKRMSADEFLRGYQL